MKNDPVNGQIISERLRISKPVSIVDCWISICEYVCNSVFTAFLQFSSFKSRDLKYVYESALTNGKTSLLAPICILFSCNHWRIFS